MRAVLLLLVCLLQPLVTAGAKKRGRDTATARGANPDLDEHGLPRKPGARAEASDHQRAHLPDRTDKRVARELQCSICVATVHEVALALPHGRGGAGVREYEIAEAMEDLCLELQSYGLALEYNVPTTRYTSNKRNGRHKGSWIENYAVNKCGDILHEFEEELVALLLPLLPADADQSMSYAKHAEAVEVFCQATLGICSESDRDMLGDWEGDGVTKMQTTNPHVAREPLQREVGDPLLDKHAEIPEGKTLEDLLPDDMPVYTMDDGVTEEKAPAGGGGPANKGKKSKQKAKKAKSKKKGKPG